MSSEETPSDRELEEGTSVQIEMTVMPGAPNESSISEEPGDVALDSLLTVDQPLYGPRQDPVTKQQETFLDIIVLQKLLLGVQQTDIARAAKTILDAGVPPQETVSALGGMLHAYESVRDFDYMLASHQRIGIRSPFHLRSNNPLHRDMLKSLGYNLDPTSLSAHGDETIERRQSRRTRFKNLTRLDEYDPLATSPFVDIRAINMRFRENRVAMLWFALLVVTVAIAPVMVMAGVPYSVSGPVGLAVGPVSILVLTAAVALFTTLNIEEILSVAAAYAAVVFLYMGTNNFSE